MNAFRRTVASVAASALTLSALVQPGANAAPVTPAEIAGDAVPATFSEDVPPIQPQDPVWRTKVQRAIADPRSEGRIQEIYAHSDAMDRDIPLVTVSAKEPGAPTYYLLNGAGGGDQPRHDWIANTDVLEFFLDQNVNLVIPMSGMFSYYIDWVESPNGNKLDYDQKWETFLTQELPGPLEERLNANGNRAIAGMSMSATSSLLLAEHNPGFYDAVGSFSGCAETSTLLGNTAARVTVQRADATPEQIWGPMGSETNVYNDALLNAEKLRDHALYISNGSGLIGETDTAGYRQEQGDSLPQAIAGSSTLAIEGGAIEGATDLCTHNLEAKLKHLGIPATYNFNNVGTHTWEYWENDLKKSWFEVIDPALNG